MQQTAAAAQNLFELDSVPPPPDSMPGLEPVASAPPPAPAGDPFGDLPDPPPPPPAPPAPPEDLFAHAPAPPAAEPPPQLARSYGMEAPLPSVPRAPVRTPGALELDVGEGRDRAQIREAGRPLARHVPPALGMEAPPKTPPPWLKIGLVLVAVGMAVGGAGRVYQANTGQSLGFGPVNTTLVAGVLLLAGIGLIVYQLLPRDR